MDPRRGMARQARRRPRDGTAPARDPPGSQRPRALPLTGEPPHARPRVVAFAVVVGVGAAVDAAVLLVLFREYCYC